MLLVACFATSTTLATSPSMLLLAKLAKIMCERLKIRSAIRSFGDSKMETKKLGR
jgi:hypothetical protein